MNPPRLPPRLAPVLFAVLSTGFASLLVSGVSTLRAVGFAPTFPQQWLSAWALSWPVAAPALYLVAPHVRRLVARLCAEA